MNKLILKIVAALMLCMAATSCSDGGDPVAANYYVRYTVIGTPDKAMDVYFTNETGKYTSLHTSMPDGKFQYVFGPVAKGFVAKVSASYVSGEGPASFLSIEVAKGCEPFVLKQRAYDGSYSAVYTIE